VTYIIAEPCIGTKDRSCIEVCPVDCIHEADKLLVIDPQECIDCAACVSECPVDAIYHESELPEEWAPFAEITHAYTPDLAVVNDLVQRYAEQGGVR
jgi:ferredoxin